MGGSNDNFFSSSMLFSVLDTSMVIGRSMASFMSRTGPVPLHDPHCLSGIPGTLCVLQEIWSTLSLVRGVGDTLGGIS
jgi:hypothetical protein